VDFRNSDRSIELTREVRRFIDEEVTPNEARYSREIAESGEPYRRPPVMVELQAKARSAGLWNLFLQEEEWGGAGLSNVEFAPIVGEMARSGLFGLEVFNCQPPDTGNIATLVACGTPEQQQRWLVPLLEAEITSCFSMTEPDVASSDARNIRSRIQRDGDEYVVSGCKWFSTGAARDTCKLCLFVGVTNPDAEPAPEQAMILIPLESPGVEVVRTMSVFGYEQPISQGEIRFTDVRVPAENLIRVEGKDGFALAQTRLGTGRVHHAMRGVGGAERALEMMCQRVASRETFGTRIADHGVIRDWIARSRIELEQARLLTLKAAWMLDEVGGFRARREIAAIKVVAPQVALNVVDRAIQAYGAAGVSQDTVLGELWAQARTLRIADGPDEVHIRSLGRWELKSQLAGTPSGPPVGSLVAS
jgi:acyl-CoA dehydrogenase